MWTRAQLATHPADRFYHRLSEGMAYMSGAAGALTKPLVSLLLEPLPPLRDRAALDALMLGDLCLRPPILNAQDD
jgi:hypothetical protein